MPQIPERHGDERHRMWGALARLIDKKWFGHRTCFRLLDFPVQRLSQRSTGFGTHIKAFQTPKIRVDILESKTHSALSCLWPDLDFSPLKKRGRLKEEAFKPSFRDTVLA